MYSKKKLNTLKDDSHLKGKDSPPIPKYELPTDEIPAELAYNLLHNDLAMDGNPQRNLATFATTWMEPEAEDLLIETANRNLTDRDKYPNSAEFELRCVNILARLWNSPDSEDALGTSTVGSSEAAMLAGLALLWNWRKQQQQQHSGAYHRPNLVLGTNVQLCWEKFCRYWDIEPRYVPVTGHNSYHVTAEDAVSRCDENTIGVVAIMGSTYDGSYEPVQALSNALDKLHIETGWDIPIHVDAASGGFIAPFLQPDLVWDFRVPRVISINASGHKYGLVYPGLGWIIWRCAEQLPKELIFQSNYLGRNLHNFTLNFSRPSSPIIAQYYNFVRLGRAGYTRILKECQDIAMYLAHKIAGLGPFELLTDGSQMPVFALKMKDSVEANSNYTLFDLSERLRDRGWFIPAYSMPPNCEHVVVQRIVIRRGFTWDLANELLEDFTRYLASLEAQPGHTDRRKNDKTATYLARYRMK